MSNRLKSTLLWTIYIAMVLIGGFTVILLVVNVLAPTFFPTVDISGIKQYINTFCTVLSFLSVGLGIYSILQANGSGKQVNEILTSIRAIEREQQLSHDLMRVITSVVDNGNTIKASEASTNGSWEPDNELV